MSTRNTVGSWKPLRSWRKQNELQWRQSTKRRNQWRAGIGIIKGELPDWGSSLVVSEERIITNT